MAGHPREGRAGRRSTWVAAAIVAGLVVGGVMAALAWPSPASAVDGLLSAARAGDLEAVARQLDATTRDEFAQSPQSVRRLKQFMPVGRDLRYRLQTEERSDDRAIVRATLTVPGDAGPREATVRFVTVREPEGWRVDMAATLQASRSALGPRVEEAADYLADGDGTADGGETAGSPAP
jgi:hypothetical protein